jgi:hypothetical protein
VRNYDPRQGQAFQGDVAIIPVPDDIVIATDEEVPAVEGRLVIQAGERSGHHHAIHLFDRIAHFRDDGLARAQESEEVRAGLPARVQGATAHLYRSSQVARSMMWRGFLTRDDLAIGCLVVAGGSVVLSHEEHDGIRIPCGRYLVVRQVASVE